MAFSTANGALLRETSRPEVYVMCDGQRVWIPTPAALAHLGFGFGQVQVVPDGALAGIAVAPIPSTTPTPGSMVFPPSKADGWAPPHAKLWPRTDVPGITLPNGTRVVTISGWITSIGDINPDDPDWHLNVEPDPASLDALGADWNTVFTLGDILSNGIHSPTPDDMHAYVATPTFHVELNGFSTAQPPKGDWDLAYAGPVPPDWHVGPDLTGLANVTWPYLPTHDGGAPGGHVFEPGDYVRISGSLITDIPHVTGFDAGWRQFWGTGLFVPVPDYKAAAGEWDAGYDETSPDCPARWTEFHPPDLINSASGPDHRREAVWGVAVVARAPDISFVSVTKSITARLTPPDYRPPERAHHYKAVATEHVGPESRLSTISNGNAASSGALITEGRDNVTVSITVTGAPFGGAPGKFKAVYRVSWADDPASYHQVVTCTPDPASVPYHTAVTLTIDSVDNETGSDLPATISLGGQQLGQARTPFAATFAPTTSRVWVPPHYDPATRRVEEGYWRVTNHPPVLIIHAGAPYPDVSLRIGTTP